MLGQDCADWLKEIGITDYNGFAPKVTAKESTDFYMSVNLKTKIKGLSSLPKVTDVLAKIESDKVLKLNEYVMKDDVTIMNTLVSTISESAKTEMEDYIKEFISTKQININNKKRKLMQRISEIKFALILSKRWFKEFESFDENKLSLKLDGQDIEFTFDLTEKEVKI